MPTNKPSGPLSLSSRIGKAVSNMTGKVKQAVGGAKQVQPPQQKKVAPPKKSLGQQNIDAANAAQAAVDAENKAKKPGWNQNQQGDKRHGVVRK